MYTVVNLSPMFVLYIVYKCNVFVSACGVGWLVGLSGRGVSEVTSYLMGDIKEGLTQLLISYRSKLTDFRIS